MARIFYGVHGTGHGHAMRGLTIARALPQHEFLFVANDDAPSVLEQEFRVARLPNLGTVFKNYRVDLPATIKKAAITLLDKSKYLKQAVRLIGEFKPDLCMTDLEFFVPRAARQTGIPCLTLDHQHIITCCRHKLPPDMWVDNFIQGLTPKWLFKPTEANIIISFYSAPIKPQYNALIAPPILRKKVLEQTPEDRGHILVYQSNSTDKRLIDFLSSSTKRKVFIYGYKNEKGKHGHLEFMEKSETGFLDHLAGCSYVIQGGSHTLMSEALYMGKPIISIPIKAMLEQRYNAFYLEKNGYGINVDMKDLNAKLLNEFEDNLDKYKANIAGKNFFGNDLTFGLVNKAAQTGKFADGFFNA